MSVLALAALFSTLASDEKTSSNDTGIFTGTGAVYGYVRNAYPDANLSPYSTVDRHGMGFKLFTGYQFNKYFGAELAYTDGIRAQYTLASPTVYEHSETSFSVTNLSVYGRLPVSKYIAFYAKTGEAYSNAREKLTEFSASRNLYQSTRFHSFAPSYGAGLSLRFGDHSELRSEYEVTRMDFGLEIRSVAMGLNWHF